MFVPVRQAVLSALAGVLVGVSLTTPARAQARGATPADPGLDSARAGLAAIEQVVGHLDGLLREARASSAARTDSTHTAWLVGVRTRLNALAAQLRTTVNSPQNPPSGQATGRRYHEWHWRTQLRTLQDAIVVESRGFPTLSKAARARHDAAMNAIRNMKA